MSMKSTQRMMDILIDVEDGKIIKTYVQIEAFDTTDYVFRREFNDFNEALRIARRVLKKISYTEQGMAYDAGTDEELN